MTLQLSILVVMIMLLLVRLTAPLNWKEHPMSQHQRDAINTMITTLPLDLGGEVAEQRTILNQLLTAHPLPDDVLTSPITLGGVPALSVEIDGQASDGTVLYFHGGVYAMGSAQASLGLASDLARRAHMRVVTVDYRLAPESPYPAAPKTPSPPTGVCSKPKATARGSPSPASPPAATWPWPHS